jgi:alanine racemase
LKTKSVAVAEIDLNSLLINFNQIRTWVKPECQVLAVVKANAYGHGAEAISRELATAGVDMLGVALVEEGVALREAGLETPILVMGGIFEDQVPEILRWRLTPVVYRLALAKALSDAALAASLPIPVHLKIDTGMGRLGLRPEEVETFARKMHLLRGVLPVGMMTHFAEADLSDKSFAGEQIKIFLQTGESLEKAGVRLSLRHIANSAAITDLPETHLDMVRPGLMLYGYHPSKSDIPLRPVLTWRTRIVFLKRVPAGTPISYGRTFVTCKESLIATLPIGYADGYSRSLSNQGEVLIRGTRAPVVGRVCMDMTMVDVTRIPGVETGDSVVLIGRDGEEEITAHEVAARAGTVCYEILSRIGQRVERVYHR